jgi:hypothetical protein
MMNGEKPGDDSAPDRVEIVLINENIRFFLDRLREANRLCVEGENGGRPGVIAALITITDFLNLFPGTTDHQHPFGRLINALLSLDDNRVLPLLKPRRRSGRPYDSAAKEIDKAWAVATAGWLQETGLEGDVADSRVAQTCSAAWLKPRGRGHKVTGRTVRGWRGEIAEDVDRHSVAARIFDKLSKPSVPRTRTWKPHAEPFWGTCRRALTPHTLEGVFSLFCRGAFKHEPCR